MKYNKEPLGSLCLKVSSGGTPKSTNAEYYDGGTIPWLNTKEVNFCRIYDTEKKITQLGLDNSAAKIIEPNRVIVAMYGATAGRVAINKIELSTNQACCNLKIDPNKADYEYVYYCLLNEYEHLASLANGGAQQNLNSLTIKNFEIPVPDLETQKKIVRVLSVLDEKIELNNQENKNLEIICEYLHKETIKNNDCKKTTIGNYCKKVITGGTPSTKDKSFWGGNIPFVTIPDMHNKVFITNTERTITEAGVIKSKITPKGSIVVSCIATVGLVGVTSLECQTNQQVNSIVPKNSYDTYFLYETLRNMDETLKAIGSTGSATLNVNKTAFSNVEIQIPNQEVIKRYHTKVSPLFKKIHKNEVENLTLISLRNNLLPKLMSGEINLDRIGT